MDFFRMKRGNAYRMAFWMLIKKMCILDLQEALTILAMSCEVEELSTDETQKILDETVVNYLEKKN